MKNILILILFTGSLAAQKLPEAPKPFFANKTNRILAITEFSVRMNDAVSTYVNSPGGGCKGCVENNLPQDMANSFPAMFAYSAAVSLVVIEGSRMLWNHNHHKMSRILMLSDSAYDASCGVPNWWITSGTLKSEPIVVHPRFNPTPLKSR